MGTDGTDAHQQPTIAEIMQIKDFFADLPHPLPIELIDQILDEAEYWAHSTVEVMGKISVEGDRMYMRTMPFALPGTEGDLKVTDLGQNSSDVHRLIGGGTGEAEAEGWVSPRGCNPARKVVFELESKDQGWSGEPDNHGSYRGSYTWFEAGVESVPLNFIREEHVQWTSPMIFSGLNDLHDSPIHFVLKSPLQTPFLHPPTHIQRNIHAGKDWRIHNIEWHYLDCFEEASVEAQDADDNGRGRKSLDGNFVRNLTKGDCITLWMRARFPGWWCYIKRAKISVYWAV